MSACEGVNQCYIRSGCKFTSFFLSSSCLFLSFPPRTLTNDTSARTTAISRKRSLAIFDEHLWDAVHTAVIKFRWSLTPCQTFSWKPVPFSVFPGHGLSADYPRIPGRKKKNSATLGTFFMEKSRNELLISMKFYRFFFYNKNNCYSNNSIFRNALCKLAVRAQCLWNRFIKRSPRVVINLKQCTCQDIYVGHFRSPYYKRCLLSITQKKISKSQQISHFINSFCKHFSSESTTHTIKANITETFKLNQPHIDFRQRNSK